MRVRVRARGWAGRRAGGRAGGWVRVRVRACGWAGRWAQDACELGNTVLMQLKKDEKIDDYFYLHHPKKRCPSLSPPFSFLPLLLCVWTYTRARVYTLRRVRWEREWLDGEEWWGRNPIRGSLNGARKGAFCGSVGEREQEKE